MVEPATLALISSAINAAGSIGGGLLSRGENQETKMQRKQRKLIDDLLASLKGQGSYNDLFQGNEDAFQRSFVDPAKSLFRNQIAPQIQQSFIQNGLQKSTGLEDTLTRAGVDLDQLLNQNYMDFYQKNIDRKQNALNSILGMGAGAPPQQSLGGAAGQGFAGFLANNDFSSLINSFGQNNNASSQNPIQNSYQQGAQNNYNLPGFLQGRKGFEY